MTRELLLICQGCGNRISDDAGYLWTHTGEVHTRQREASGKRGTSRTTGLRQASRAC